MNFSTSFVLSGAAGALEIIFTILACKSGLFPPTINHKTPEEEFRNMDFIPNVSKKWETNGERRIALKNSFGFGGTNVSLCVSEFIR